MDEFWSTSDFTTDGGYISGSVPQFGSIYSDPAVAEQASVDWNRLLFTGVSRAVDLQFQELFKPSVTTNATPRTEGGNVAGQPALTMTTAAPWLIGAGLALALIVFALRK